MRHIQSLDNRQQRYWLCELYSRQYIVKLSFEAVELVNRMTAQCEQSRVGLKHLNIPGT